MLLITASRLRVMTVVALVALLASILASAGMLPMLDPQVALAADPPPPGENIVVNGSFEEPIVVAATRFQQYPEIQGWNLSFGRSIELQRREGGEAHSGSQYLELDSDASSGVFQILDTEPGTVYELSFAFSARPATPDVDNHLGIYWNEEALEEVGPRSNTGVSPAWTTHQYKVVASSFQTRLEFRDLGDSDSFGTFVDTVSVRALGCKTVKSGDWDDPDVWSCGKAPGQGNDAIIDLNHLIKLKKEASVKTLETKEQAKLDLLSQKLNLFGNLKHQGVITSSSQAKGIINLDYSTTKPQGELQEYIKKLEGQLQLAGDDAQLANVDLQNALQKQQQTLQMMSNISKMLHDTAMSVIRKIGAVEAGTVASTGSTDMALLNTTDPVLKIVSETGEPIDLDSLTIDPGTSVALGPNTHLTILTTLANYGSFFLSETSTLSLGDGATLTGSGEIIGDGVFDDNALATLGTIEASPNPVLVDNEVSAQASFVDTGVQDTHSAVWDWGDGTQCDTAEAGAACEIQESNGSGMVTGRHSYAQAGLYRVTLSVTDDDGVSEGLLEYVVVYDPSAGFVTGGGWIDTPSGAYPVSPDASGETQVSFDARYQADATLPSGSLDILFESGDLDFSATTFDWLVITGDHAYVSGSGTINGEGDYRFLLSFKPDISRGGKPAHAMRVKIWDPAQENLVIFDSQMGAPDDAEATTVMGGGSVQIHTQGNPGGQPGGSRR